jgi:peroxiredoxin (alkyl hydroperoxide reductase subunit C)
LFSNFNNRYLSSLIPMAAPGSCQDVPAAVIGQPAPEFKGLAVLPSTEFKEISLSQYKGKWLVLFSYPLDFTFVCPTEIIAFSNAYGKFKAAGAEIVGLSVDSVYSHLAWIGTDRKQGGLGSITIPLIGDLGAKISKQYGFYMCTTGHDLRGTVIIDPDGIVQHLSYNQPDVGRNIEEVLRLVQGYQFARTHGEVCPAQWQAGADTIKPNPKDSKAFFAKH